ncbi:coiled-coil domain-containing protein [Limosilactobacillus reuteri]|uniref:hypothetical protein n=1 Tax=Limosilactobacillus reuteri TaxID=1598 RepID=UPI002B056907|nr:hypothetical protein [Limosilactobacillus reuteri]
MFTIVLMSNSDLFDKLYQEINRQNTFYFWVVGIVVSVAIAIAAFFGILQWRLSDKQIQKMKNETRQELEELYQFSNMRDKINEIKGDLASIKQEVEKLGNDNNANKQNINSLLKTENDIESITPGKISIDPTEIHFSLEKTLLESDIISLMHADNDDEIKRLSDGIKDKIENLMNDKSSNDINKRVFLIDVYNRLNRSNKKNVKSLGEYLSQKYKLI